MLRYLPTPCAWLMARQYECGCVCVCVCVGQRGCC
jgi:hypothetical protein